MKKNNKFAESLVWIIIWVFILSFVLLWIWKLIWNSRETITLFDEQMQIDILSKNTSTIIDQLDLSVVDEWDVFYIYKDNTNKDFKIFIWEHNREYKYIDRYWNKIDDPLNYNWIVYERIIQTKKININWELKTAVKILIEKFNK